MVVSFLREHMEDPKWDYALKRGRSAVRLWMQERVKVDALDIGPPTRPCGDTESMQFVVYVQEVAVNGLLMASGKDGVFTREFYESDADRNRFKIVHLPDHPTLEVAQRQSARMAEVSAGVVNTKRGFAIRVIAARYESAVKTLHPHDSERLLGKRWEISGLPLSMGRIALMEFLDTWRVPPEYTFRQGTRRTWIVRAATDPAFTKVQHDQGLAVVKEAQARFFSDPSTDRKVRRDSRTSHRICYEKSNTRKILGIDCERRPPSRGRAKFRQRCAGSAGTAGLAAHSRFGNDVGFSDFCGNEALPRRAPEARARGCEAAGRHAMRLFRNGRQRHGRCRGQAPYSSCWSGGQCFEETEVQQSTKQGCKIMAFITSGFSEILCIFWCTFIGTAEGWVSGAALRGEVTPSHRSCDEARNCIAGSEGEFACINIFICKSLSGIIRGGNRSVWTI